ncbi:glucosaminidase domain-containing protein [Neobacillus bataviensis]|uniref:glucosaminidase domain-containing protein n=1 Tax=Neobacillus bataviensis TaxID=220685 RepID=UPI00295877F9|nr:glucosaminidase domain-containing protein [Neobacillus bataviensis]
MKKVVFRSFLVVLLLMGIFHSKASAAQTTAASVPNEMSVFVTELPVYRSFEELSDFRIHLDPNYQQYAELKFNDKVTFLSQKDYAAEIQMADGRTGWVHKDYLTSDLSKQTWLVKEWRNVRDNPTTPPTSGKIIPNHSKVYVLDYDPASNYFKVRTADGLLEGWIYGLYLKDESYKPGAGSNIIPYEFENEGKVTNNITIFTPLNTKANVTVNQLNEFINYKTGWKQTLMTGMGSAYLEAQNNYSVNAIYLLAHSGLETKWGTSDIVKTKMNFYGIGADDNQPAANADTFSAARSGIVDGAKWINENYISREKSNVDYPFSQPTLDNMRFNHSFHQYSTDQAWAGKIAQIAKEFNAFTANTGWKNLNGNWYFYNSNWTLAKGWLLTGGKWYYLNSSGVMLTGWQYINGKWYYLNPAGDMKTGWLDTGGKWYYLDQSGAMKTGWVSTGGKWYYMNNSGVMLTGWVKVTGKWYYLYNDGHMAANTTIGGYRLGKDGAML